jgi:hypothetical protein
VRRERERGREGEGDREGRKGNRYLVLACCVHAQGEEEKHMLPTFLFPSSFPFHSFPLHRRSLKPRLKLRPRIRPRLRPVHRRVERRAGVSVSSGVEEEAQPIVIVVKRHPLCRQGLLK